MTHVLAVQLARGGSIQDLYLWREIMAVYIMDIIKVANQWILLTGLKGVDDKVYKVNGVNTVILLLP